MPRQLVQLLKSYEFLNDARNMHGRNLPMCDATALESNIDRLFLDIVTHVSNDSRVTLVQARFLLSRLVDLVSDKEKGDVLRDACHRHLNQLESFIAQTPVAPRQTSIPQYRYLDSLTDRVGVIDSEYRYVFTNKANAAFHGKDAADFVGMPNWILIGTKYFEQANKPRFDQCLAGQSVACISAHPTRDPSRIHSARFDPVIGAGGRVEAIIVTCRDVSNLSIPAEMITPLP